MMRQSSGSVRTVRSCSSPALPNHLYPPSRHRPYSAVSGACWAFLPSFPKERQKHDKIDDKQLAEGPEQGLPWNANEYKHRGTFFLPDSGQHVVTSDAEAQSLEASWHRYCTFAVASQVIVI